METSPFFILQKEVMKTLTSAQASRNPAYGAYNLRKACNRTIVNALLMTLGVVLMVMAAIEAYQQGKLVYASIWIAGIFLVACAVFRLYIEQITLLANDEK